MKEQKYVLFSSEHREKIRKAVFIVNSFSDSKADKSSEELIIQLLKSKISNEGDNPPIGIVLYADKSNFSVISDQNETVSCILNFSSPYTA